MKMKLQINYEKLKQKYVIQLKSQEEKIQQLEQDIIQKEGDFKRKVRCQSKAKVEYLNDQIQELQKNQNFGQDDHQESQQFIQQKTKIKQLEQDKHILSVANINNESYVKQLNQHIAFINDSLKEKTEELDQLNRDYDQQKNLNIKLRDEEKKLQIKVKEIDQKAQTLIQQNEKLEENIKQIQLLGKEQEKNYIEQNKQNQQSVIQDSEKKQKQYKKKIQQEIKQLSESNLKFKPDLEDEKEKSTKLQIQINQQIKQINKSEQDLKYKEIFLGQSKNEINQLNQEIQRLKENLEFMAKVKQNKRVDQVIPLIFKIQKDIYDEEKLKSIDPFSNDQLMLQNEEYCHLKIQQTNMALENIAQNGHPPNFDKSVDIQWDSTYVVMIKSIHPNQTSSFFNGYFIKEDLEQATQSLLVVKEEDNIRQPYDLSDAKQQIGNRFLLEFFIQKFNQQLDILKLDYPQLKLPKYQCIKKKQSDKYYYIEEIANRDDLQSNTQKYKLYTDSLRYFSYCFSKRYYMITDIHIYGNIIYDVIISSKHGILSSFDQGNNELINQSFALHPNRYNYSNYAQFMSQLEH